MSLNPNKFYIEGSGFPFGLNNLNPSGELIFNNYNLNPGLYVGYFGFPTLPVQTGYNFRIWRGNGTGYGDNLPKDGILDVSGRWIDFGVIANATVTAKVTVNSSTLAYTIGGTPGTNSVNFVSDNSSILGATPSNNNNATNKLYYNGWVWEKSFTFNTTQTINFRIVLNSGSYYGDNNKDGIATVNQSGIPLNVTSGKTYIFQAKMFTADLSAGPSFAYEVICSGCTESSSSSSFSSSSSSSRSSSSSSSRSSSSSSSSSSLTQSSSSSVTETEIIYLSFNEWDGTSSSSSSSFSSSSSSRSSSSSSSRSSSSSSSRSSSSSSSRSSSSSSSRSSSSSSSRSSSSSSSRSSSSSSSRSSSSSSSSSSSNSSSTQSSSSSTTGTGVIYLSFNEWDGTSSSSSFLSSSSSSRSSSSSSSSSSSRSSSSSSSRSSSSSSSSSSSRSSSSSSSNSSSSSSSSSSTTGTGIIYLSFNEWDGTSSSSSSSLSSSSSSSSSLSSSSSSSSSSSTTGTGIIYISFGETYSSSSSSSSNPNISSSSSSSNPSISSSSSSNPSISSSSSSNPSISSSSSSNPSISSSSSSGLSSSSSSNPLYSSSSSSSLILPFTQQCCRLPWNTIPIASNYSDVDISENGRFQYIISNNLVEQSINFGVSWSGINNPNWSGWEFTSIANSKDGKYVYLTATNKKIQFSNDSGISWQELSTSPSRPWKAIDISDDAKYIGLIDDVVIYKSFNSGFSWVTENLISPWKYIAISENGQYWGVLGSGTNIYISNNYGQNWSPKDEIRNWNRIKISSNGLYQIASEANGGIYTSNNYGNTWQYNYINTDICSGAVDPTDPDNAACCFEPWSSGKADIRNWKSVAISERGGMQIAASDYRLYISNNRGDSWRLLSWCDGFDWTSVDVSYNGERMFAAARNEEIQYSYNYGVTWNSIPSGTLSVKPWESISISYEAKHLLVVSSSGGFNDNGSIYRSSDYGATWSEVNLQPVENDGIWRWLSASISANGKFQAVVGNDLNIYISEDYGNTWYPRAFRANWNRVDISNDGKYIIATQSNGNLYISKNYGRTWDLNLITIGECYSSSSSSAIFCNDDSQCPPNTICIAGICVSNRYEVRVKKANFYYEIHNKFERFFDHVDGFGNIQRPLQGMGSGIISDPTGWQPSIIKVTGRLTGVVPRTNSFGRFTWNNLNLSTTVQNNQPVYLSYITGHVPATNRIIFLDNTGFGLTVGDRININNINFYYNPQPQGLFEFSSPQNLVNILNSGYREELDDNGVIKFNIGVSGVLNNNTIRLYSLYFSGEEGNKLRVYKETQNLNAIKIPFRYFQNGKSLRPTTNRYTQFYNYRNNLTVENSGFYTELFTGEPFEGPIQDVGWVDEFKQWEVKTGIFMQGMSDYPRRIVYFDSGNNIISGSGIIPSGRSLRFTGLNIEISKRAPYNIENNYALYLLEGSGFKYSGLLKG